MIRCATIALMAGVLSLGLIHSAAASAEEKVAKPTLLQKVDPKYPADAKSEKVQGTVKVQAIIDTQGNVAEATASESPDARLSQAAVDAVRQWKFKPAHTLAGKPVKAKTTITVNFRLK